MKHLLAINRKALRIQDHFDPRASGHAEDTAADPHALADECVTLDLAGSPDAGPCLDLDEGPDPGMGADATPVQVREGLNHDILAQCHIMQLPVRRLVPGKSGLDHP